MGTNFIRENKVKIIRAGIENAAEILALQKLAYLSEAEKYNDFKIPPLLQTLPEIEAEFSTNVFLKAELGPAIIGSVRAFSMNDTCHIGRLIVHPRYQGNGIGSALLSEIEKYIGTAGRLEIFTGKDSLASIHLYKKHGYRQSKFAKLSDKVELVYMEKFTRVQEA
jgi:ribosomal protein S18 acetylase RimI-like enzyme